jgi:alpha-L-fucosidase
MMISKKNLLPAVIGLLAWHTTLGQSIKPYGATPSASQLQWHDMEYYMFIHFGPNTFTNVEWGDGREKPAVFNPAKLNCRQWAKTAKQAGMKAIIITAKHHDGFCLWPSQYSTHTVRESPWKNGQGDVLRELSDACREEGLKFGVYLSPWDRNHPQYGTPEYNTVFVNMLHEVLGNYGPVFEQWFDGANGEGPNGKKQVYDWPLFNNTVYAKQPQAIIFSDGGPGCRWVGNENGYAGETNWNTLNGELVYPGYPNYKELTPGHEDGTHWIPAECDVSIRPGWFYSPDTDSKVKSVDQLMDIYLGSVGRGANLLLNVPVNREGLIAKEDSTRLMEFHQARARAFPTNLVSSATVLGNGKKVKQLTDGNNNTFWAAPNKQASVELHWKQPTTVQYLVLREHLAVGQRVRAFQVDVWDNGQYVPLHKQTTIGNKRILTINKTTAKIRITVSDTKAEPVLQEVEVY